MCGRILISLKNMKKSFERGPFGRSLFNADTAFDVVSGPLAFWMSIADSMSANGIRNRRSC